MGHGPEWAVVPNVAKSVVPSVAVPSDPVPSDVAPTVQILDAKIQSISENPMFPFSNSQPFSTFFLECFCPVFKFHLITAPKLDQSYDFGYRYKMPIQKLDQKFSNGQPFSTFLECFRLVFKFHLITRPKLDQSFDFHYGYKMPIQKLDWKLPFYS
jgi:hypothetical protein